MNPVHLQKQLRENANDLQDFYKDLKGWGDEMKRKEDSLKNVKEPLKKAKIATPSKKVSKEKISKIGSTDYNKWEKFDAELECERLEDDYNDDSELTDEFEESARDEALVHKDKGNCYVKMKDWDKAIDCYSKAISCYSYDPIFYANRGLCYLKKGDFVAAEEDCTLSLRLDRTYVKALQRRAVARENLGKLELAEKDLELVLYFEPKNTESTAALKKIRTVIGPKKEAIKSDERPVSKFTASRIKTLSEPVKIDTSITTTSLWPDPGCEIRSVKAISKPAHLRSRKPLKRVKIIETDSVVNEATTAIKTHVVEHVKQVTFEDDDEGTNKKVSLFKKSQEQNNKDKLQVLNETNVILPLENKPKAQKNTENIFITQMDNKIVTESNKQKLISEATTMEFAVPKTSVQFYNTWKSIKTDKDKYKYLKLINPEDLPNIFRESLDSNQFSSILEVLENGFMEHGDDVYPFLLGLTQVKRFSTLRMFMSDKDKIGVSNLINYVQTQVSDDQVKKLILEYEL